MSAEGETEKVYEQVFPTPQQVNGVRQGTEPQKLVLSLR